VAAVTAEMLAAAHAYAAAGLPVMPVWWPDGARCACPGAASCKAPGKHPLSTHGLDDATTDLDVITTWWRRWPRANVAVRPPAGVVVLDIDPRHHGATALVALEREHAPVPPTWAARTGGHGLHCWYRYLGPLRAELCAGVDLKSSTGYVVTPPARHVSGAEYRWITDHPVAPLPGWMRKMLTPPETVRPAVQLPAG